MPFDPEPLLRLGAAALLSLPIGLEREISGKPAGVRTHLLLAVATAGLGWLSIEAAEGRSGADATRIASYTVAGIGFLGAGLIVGVRGRVHGLTTAVAAFTVMTMGLLAGMGQIPTATTLALISLVTLGPIQWLKPRTYGHFVREVSTLHVLAKDADHIPIVQEAVAASEVELQEIDYVRLGEAHVALHITVRGRSAALADLMTALQGLEESHGLSAFARVVGTLD
ncbi:MAG TPA: MgtC/SapB family protein [Euzebya sp.]|nr:MgtC/SapB family protein [Euzebya sp.]